MIPDRGILAETSPLKLLLAMDEQNQTGILYLRKNDVLKVFYLNQGKISWAISSDEEDKIEHVLLSKKLVNPDALAPYLAGNKISESFGKVLVENGLISLETLINASRDQMKRITTSVLFWNSGTYQLESESPPTRLVSLELEIAPLVYNYIQTHMDVNIIWEEIGSLSGELQQVPAPEKIFQYNLDADQQEVFSCFREAQRPEAVLLRFSAERKHSILKILYFLLITGLLVKKEAGLAAALDFNELDSLFGNAQPDAPNAVIVDSPGMINESDIKDIPQLDFPDMQENPSITEVSLPGLSEPTPDVRDEAKENVSETHRASQAQRTAARIRPLLQDKPKSRWRSVSFISILLTVVAIALFVWFNRAPEIPAPQNPGTRPAGQARPKPPQRQAVPAAAPKTEAENASPGLPSTPVAEQKVKTEASASGSPSAAATAAEKPLAVEKKPDAVRTPTGTAETARQAFASGNFSSAGDLWRNELVAAKITYSILLEMDCLAQSVHSAYDQVTDKENFFLLNRVKAGRNCWLVLWGKFRTQNEALQNLKLVPEYFFKQSAPPAVIELEPYL
jgi:hypothetical protein